MGTGPSEAVRTPVVDRVAPVTRRWARTSALTAYAGLFVLWSELLGIPKRHDPGLRLALAGHDRLARRGASRATT